MAYQRNPTWQDSPSTATPITAASLNAIEDALVNASQPMAPYMLQGLLACSVADPAMITANTAMFSGVRFCYKMWTPAPIAPKQMYWHTTGAGATRSGFYSAIYDSTGTLIPSSGSGDVAGDIVAAPTYTNLRADGAAVAVPAGYFFLAFKLSSASPFPNCGVTNGNYVNGQAGVSTPGPTAFRFGFMQNDWSGATPPATTGNISGDYRAFVVGVR